MKTVKFLLIVSLVVFYSCTSGVKTQGHKVAFGMYETVKISEMPDSIIDTLKSMNVIPEKDPQRSIIGYITKADSSVLQLDLSHENFKLVRTYAPVDKGNKYYAILALNRNPFIDNSQIQKTRVNGNNVEIYFNMEGAKKWADFTKKNIGKTVAFVIDNRIYDMPEIGSRMVSGVAAIQHLESETLAKNISESLNSSIPE